VAFESGTRGGFSDNPDPLRFPININSGRSRPLTGNMWEQLFLGMNQAALDTDMRIYQAAVANAGITDREGFDYLLVQRNRFVITSIERGSILIGGAIFLAATGAWFFKKFIEPGWVKSESKKQWDDLVAASIDTAVPILKERINQHVVNRFKRLNIKQVSLSPPTEYIDGQLPDVAKATETVYDPGKPIAQRITQQIIHKK
jgi:hypothetical protein